MRMSLTDLTRIRMVNATMICLTLSSLRIVPGSMYVKDFLRELDKLNIEIGQEELDEINRISDSTGKVFPPRISFSKQTSLQLHPDHESRV